jgi:hypothetical protein
VSDPGTVQAERYAELLNVRPTRSHVATALHKYAVRGPRSGRFPRDCGAVHAERDLLPIASRDAIGAS